MEVILHFFESYGVAGLFFVAFIESFISPILPDIMLIPMALAAPDQAIYYSAVVTAASVLGGYIGYGIGAKLGVIAMKRFVPERHSQTIERWMKTYGGWAIFLAAMAPIPYKFVCITAGTFRTNMLVFTIASVLGRGKRFLIVGILVHYFGPSALESFNKMSGTWLAGGAAVLLVSVLLWYYYKHKQQQSAR